MEKSKRVKITCNIVSETSSDIATCICNINYDKYDATDKQILESAQLQFVNNFFDINKALPIVMLDNNPTVYNREKIIRVSVTKAEIIKE